MFGLETSNKNPLIVHQSRELKGVITKSDIYLKKMIRGKSLF